MVLILISALYFYSNLLSEVVSPIVAHKELGRMFQLFLLQSELGNGITLEVANTAIKYHEARKMSHEADQDKRRI